MSGMHILKNNRDDCSAQAHVHHKLFYNFIFHLLLCIELMLLNHLSLEMKLIGLYDLFPVLSLCFRVFIKNKLFTQKTILWEDLGEELLIACSTLDSSKGYNEKHKFLFSFSLQYLHLELDISAVFLQQFNPPSHYIQNGGLLLYMTIYAVLLSPLQLYYLIKKNSGSLPPLGGYFSSHLPNKLTILIDQCLFETHTDTLGISFS